jgi:cyclopropane-fatty-acyl-phospholipid synthase
MDHYDLSNDFFALFLDPSMTYSSGIYSSPVTTLKEAQQAKLDRMISLAQIGPDDHVLEIGCGWGGFAIRAATTTGCRVTGITLSPSQLAEAQKRVKAAGLEKQIELKLIDYRKMSGQFDKIVSIEMLEAVGHEHFESYFSSIDRLLKKDGIVALQGITIPDHRYASYLQGVDWIQKHIFPGGEIASVSGLSTSMARSSKLTIERLDSFPLDYAQTLRDWRKIFHERIDEVRKLGFGDDFIRTWDYYFCYCEAGFNERVISVIQLQLSRPHNNKLKRY